MIAGEITCEGCGFQRTMVHVSGNGSGNRAGVSSRSRLAHAHERKFDIAHAHTCKGELDFVDIVRKVSTEVKARQSILDSHTTQILPKPKIRWVESIVSEKKYKTAIK